LNLSNNKISDLNIFEKTKFEKIKTLNLQDNKINLEENSSIIDYLKSKIICFNY